MTESANSERELSQKERLILGCASLLRGYPSRGKTVLWKALQKHLKPKGYVRVRFPLGYEFVADMREFWQRQMIAGCYDRREFWLLSQLIGEGDIFLDVGANVGYYTLLAAARVKHGRVYAFEASPRIVGALKQNIDLNARLNIDLIEAAVSNSNGRTRFYLPPDNGWQSVEASLIPMENGSEYEVQTVTLDHFLESRDIHKVQLCKLDIEGAEPEALAGAQRSLEKGVIESLACEIRTETFDAMNAKMAPLNFELTIDQRTLQPISKKTKIEGVTNILWLRGQCAKRWQQNQWKKFYV